MHSYIKTLNLVQTASTTCDFVSTGQGFLET